MDDTQKALWETLRDKILKYDSAGVHGLAIAELKDAVRDFDATVNPNSETPAPTRKFAPGFPGNAKDGPVDTAAAPVPAAAAKEATTGKPAKPAVEEDEDDV